MSNDRMFDYHKHNSVYISDYIKFADTKAGVALTVTIIIFSFFIKKLQDKFTSISTLPEASIVFLLISLIIIGIGIYYLGSTIWPRYSVDKNFYHSWGGISAFQDSNEYKISLSLKFQDENTFLADMASQNYDLAKICKTKYENLRKAFFSVSIGTLLAGITWFFS